MSASASSATTNAYSYSEVPTRWAGPEGVERLLLLREVEEFLFFEADLLDQWRYREWLELTTDDIRYWMPVRRNVKFGNWERERSAELAELAWFDENRRTLEMRVEQLMTGEHWAAEPLSRVSHLITNVRVADRVERESVEELTVRCRFLVYRNHLDDEEAVLIGKREDVLRRVDDRPDADLRLARRSIFLDQSVLLAKNLTFLI
jgi:3-phenylpropionate/cinnamic acid dioxygenase small subunit